tara:strand:+ start:188 stop:562 length:375 start_codon:yes stop_codon:yes gene_type:complete
MTWWQKLFYGFNTTTTVKEEDGRGEVTSPTFIAYLEDVGFIYNDRWCWWVREWTTPVKGGKESVLEVYQLEITSFGGRMHPDVKTEFGKKWDYMILSSNAIPEGPGGSWGGNAVIWENNIGERE